jgi:hypothetical protein
VSEKCVRDRIDKTLHTIRVGLDDCIITVQVHDDAGQTIALSVHPAVA